MTGRPSYHDLYITTENIPRTSIFNLPYCLTVMCSRVTGWQLWDLSGGYIGGIVLAGEYEGPGKWLVLDVNGHVIVDSRRPADEKGGGVIEGSGQLGEPRRLDQMVSARLNPELVAAARQYAQQHGMSLSDVIRHALEQLTGYHETPVDPVCNVVVPDEDFDKMMKDREDTLWR